MKKRSIGEEDFKDFNFNVESDRWFEKLLRWAV